MPSPGTHHSQNKIRPNLPFRLGRSQILLAFKIDVVLIYTTESDRFGQLDVC